MGLLSLLKLDSSAHLDHNLIRALLRSNVVVDRTEGEYNPNTTTCPFFIAVFQCWLAAGDRRNGSVDSREGFLRALEHVVREEGDDSERALDAVYEQLCIWRKAVPATFHDVILDRMMARLESGGGSGDTGANQ